jgi:flavin reductase (DIM6/NTAB) family NADH-FMN oxidoreductase RutF
MSDPVEVFNELTGETDYAMLIVTAAADGRQAGCLVGFATQCSIDPPRFLVCISEKNRTLAVADRSAVLAVHFVPWDADGLVELFGGETGDDLDKFSRCRWHPGPRGVPVLDACRRWFAGAIAERLDFGDHRGFVLEPLAGEAGGDPRPFPFRRARRLEPGHQP